MNRMHVNRGLVLGCVLAAGGAVAQQAAPAVPTGGATPSAVDAPQSSAPPPAQRSAQMEAGEPRADTTAQTAPGSQNAAAARDRMSTSSRSPKPATTLSRARGVAAQQPPAANDRVELDTTTVTGNQELPKVLYIVPWKKSDIGDLAGKPMNSLLDEVLAPVDRDVFRREVRYYHAVKSDAAKSGAGAGVPAAGAPAQQVEK
ncbi:MAG TPA: hypothetical protein VKG05_15595 [Steroidobacteraceae bacterium]|nr:hypothetical protein [Steroidobacteraceae bacterium]